MTVEATPETFRPQVLGEAESYPPIARFAGAIMTACPDATFAAMGMDEVDMAEFAMAVEEITGVDLSGDKQPLLEMSFGQFHAHCLDLQAEDERRAAKAAKRQHEEA